MPEELYPWHRGDQITASRLNQGREDINERMRRVDELEARLNEVESWIRQRPWPKRFEMMQVVTEHSDYLDCLFVVTQKPVKVAKPYKLRHVLANYDELTSLTTVSVNEITVSDGSTTETWKVTPNYEVGDQFVATRVDNTGVTVNNETLHWLDVHSRVWAVEV